MAKINIEELQRMRDVDIKSVDVDTLVDLQSVQVKKNLPVPERVADFISQIGNPYCFKVGDTVVKLKFKENGPSCQEAFYNLADVTR